MYSIVAEESGLLPRERLYRREQRFVGPRAVGDSAADRDQV